MTIEQKTSTGLIEILWRVTRIPNLIIIGFTQYLVAIFLIHGTTLRAVLTDWKLFLLVVASVSIAGAGYVINDYYDVKIDYINKPDRVVIGSSLKRRKAMMYHTFLNFLGIGLGFLVSVKIGVINIAVATWLWFYSNQLKRLPLIGNISVALLTALSIYIIGLYYHDTGPRILAYAFFAFGVSLVREVIKDMEDLRGDARYGCKTLPIIWGIRKTKYFLFILSIGFIGTIYYIAISIPNYPLFFYFLILGIMVVIFLIRLYKADTIKAYGQLSNLCKLFMLFGILSMTFFT